MNTLLGEIATLNDIQYVRYRAAFKFRKLQKNFYLEHLSVNSLQEIFNVTGVQTLDHTAEIPPSQLRTIIMELYTTLRTLKPILGTSKLKLAQELCFNWLQMVYECAEGGTIDCGSLKLIMCMFMGGKPADKSRFIFNLLANANGAIELEGLKYFCQATQRIGYSVQERLYSSYTSYQDIFHECLTFVRSEEDIEDEELDGGIKRQWLSQFEFAKLFNTLPEPRFLGWMALWYSLPVMENVVHSVRCGVCTRKPIISFRYQCTQCQSFNLCQMCFLKGRTTEKHDMSHKVVEISTPSKGHKSWRRRILGIAARQENGRIWDDPREPFVFTPRHALISLGTLSDHNRSGSKNSIHAISEMFNSSQAQVDVTSPDGLPQPSHQPTILRIGSGDKPKKQTHHQPQPPHPLEKSTTKQNGSPLRRTESLKVQPAYRSEGSPVRVSYRRDARPSVGLHPLSECARCESPDLIISERKFGNGGPNTVGNVYSDLQTDKRMSLISTSTAGSGSATSDAPCGSSLYHDEGDSPQQSPLAVGMVGDSNRLQRMMHRSGYENVEGSLPNRQQEHLQLQRTGSGAQEDLEEVQRRLSMEVDQLLGQIGEPNTYADYDVPRSIYGNRSQQRLKFEERALQGQLDELSNKRDKLANELHGLITQVHSLRTGFSPRRSGAHSHTNSESSMDSDLLTPPATAGGPAGRQQQLLHPLHFRGESVPSHLPGPAAAYSLHGAAAGKSGSLGRVNPSNSHLLDPLVDFTDEELSTESHPARVVGPIDNYRVSMQW